MKLSLIGGLFIISLFSNCCGIVNEKKITEENISKQVDSNIYGTYEGKVMGANSEILKSLTLFEDLL